MFKIFVRLAKRLLAKNKFANNRFFKKLLNSKEKTKIIKQVKKAKSFDVRYISEKKNAWTTSNKNPHYTKLAKIPKLTSAEKRKYLKSVEPVRERLIKALIKIETAPPNKKPRLSKLEQEALNHFTTLELSESLSQKSNQRYWYFTFESGWLKNGVYDAYTKMCYLKTHNSIKTYSFFGVPKTKMKTLIIANSAGKYMWEYFGKHYSVNSQRWERK